MEHKGKRICMSIFGVLVSGISVGFFRMAAFGVDPFQSFVSGLNTVIPINFGTLYMIVNVILLIFGLIANRHNIGLATFINLFLLGYVVDFSNQVLLNIFPALQILGRILFLIIGIVVMCLAASFYMTADLGVSTYDSIALILSDTWHLGQFRFCRIATDVVCVICGVGFYFISGGTISGLGTVAGIGTVVTAFFMGPLIDWFNVHLARPFLEKT